AARHAHRSAAHPPAVHTPQCHALLPALRLCLAAAACGLATVEDGQPRFPHMATGWDMGAHSHPAASAPAGAPCPRPRTGRRLSKDSERLCSTSEAWIYLAMLRLMLRLLARL